MDVSSDRLSLVGKALEEGQVYSIEHPAYHFFAESVQEELSAIAHRETQRRELAQKLVFTSALDPEQINDLGETYPEFSITTVPLNARIHAYWTASRLCANEWLAKTVGQYADTVVHYGGSILSTVLQQRRGFHVELDPTDEVMVNEDHTSTVDLHRLYGDFVRARSLYNLLLPRQDYDDYLRGRGYASCCRPHVCPVKADALCVDLSATMMSPEQVALAMIQHSSELCHGFFIYHPSMLVQKSGVFERAGVGFTRERGQIVFSYPEGRAGVSMYPIQAWSRWLASHTFSVGFGTGKTWFQLELLKNRDCFMFFRMVKIDAPAADIEVRHALELPGQDDYVVVRSWRFPKGLLSDTSDASLLEEHHFLVPGRLERRVREFALQLTPGQFNRAAIKKQARVVNSRWVMHGTTVTTSPISNPQDIEDLTTAVMARAFNDRYESSQLASDLMSRLNSVANFKSASASEREKLISAALLMAEPKAPSRFMTLLDRIETYWSDRPSDRPIQVQIAPSYVTLRSLANSWKTMFHASGEKLFQPGNIADLAIKVESTSLGGSLASAYKRYRIPSGQRRGSDLARMEDAMRVCTDVVDMRQATGTSSTSAFVEAVSSVENVEKVHDGRYHFDSSTVIREAPEIVGDFKSAVDADPVYLLNQMYSDVFPDVAATELENDQFSLSLDPQDRVLAAPYLKMQRYFGLPPAPRAYFRSRLKALNVPKRQNTSQELLTAIAARNLSAPAISLAQEESIIEDIFSNFIKVACHEDAPALLARYSADPVALADDALAEWAAKANPDVLRRVTQELTDNARTMAEKSVGDYMVMLKADVKPTLSVKPVTEITAPQVIVYHEKPLSALYSSIFRVLVQRFLSLLRPEFHVNLLKDVKDIGRFLTAAHPYSAKGLKYLENDFSKFDKSQSQFAFDLEYYVFQRLGLNQEMLDKWLLGHVECSLRSVSTGLSLHVLYQRKSGDATTAFGNVMLNLMSVLYAYKDTKIAWALFMGDDSLVCSSAVSADGQAVKIMAEVFNLTAKYYVTDSPYFSSNFVVIDRARGQVRLLPDPVKRVEKMSMHISADDPQWSERYVSFKDAMAGYLDPSSAHQLAVLVPQRYAVQEGYIRGAASAFGTLARDYKSFRSVWEDEPIILQG